MRGLIRDGKIPFEALDDIAVAFCGRGSGLFVRLHGDDPYAVTVISRILRIIAAAAGQTRAKYPQVQVSPYPKIEVAAGLIIKARTEGLPGTVGTPQGSSRDEPDEIVMDEGGEMSPSNREEGDPYSTMAVHVGDEDWKMFLNVFAQVVGCKVNESDQQHAKIVNGVSTIDTEDANNKRPKQSVFIAMLKGLIELMRHRQDNIMRPATTWT